MNYQKQKGTVDILPEEGKKWQYVEQVLRTIAGVYNFKEIRTPMFEATEVFNRAAGETSDMVSKEMYTFNDKGERSITLRPEGTAGVVRAYVENKQFALPETPNKYYYMGPMFRYERPQKGRQRQFNQFGVEALGVESPTLDVEVIAMAVTIFESLGIKDVSVVINTLGDQMSRASHKEALINHFKPHIDELCSDCKTRLEKNPLRILDCKVDRNNPLMASAPKTIDYLTDEAKSYFEEVCELLDSLEIKYVVDSNLVRGLDYYSHTVFEVISSDERLGAQSTLCGGGRYNGLVKEFGGPETPGIGFAFGMERLMMVADIEEEVEGLDAYIMTAGKDGANLGLQIATMLRVNGLSVEMNHQETRSFKSQFKSVDRNNTHFVIIVGQDEVDKEAVQIKCVHDKEQQEVKLENILEFIENHLGGHDHE